MLVFVGIILLAALVGVVGAGINLIYIAYHPGEMK